MNNIHMYLHRLHNPDLGILFIRIALGAVFINAGWLKLDNMDLVVSGFGTIGLHPFFAYLVAYTELISGILYILGMFVRYAGVATAIVMIVAIFKVHLAFGFSLANGGYEYTFALLMASLAMITFGAGRYSVKSLLQR